MILNQIHYEIIKINLWKSDKKFKLLTSWSTEFELNIELLMIAEFLYSTDWTRIADAEPSLPECVAKFSKKAKITKTAKIIKIPEYWVSQHVWMESRFRRKSQSRAKSEFWFFFCQIQIDSKYTSRSYLE